MPRGSNTTGRDPGVFEAHSRSPLVFRLQTQLHIGHVEYDLKLHLRQLSLPFHLAFTDLDALF